MNRRKNPSKQKKAADTHASLTSMRKLPLTGFKAIMWPTMLPVKLVYGDDRVLTASASQADYVYRANSLFDCDFSGVGGQPQGFDQLKTLYNQYRVVAVKVDAWAFANATDGNGGILVIAPSGSSTSYVSAEEVAGLAFAKSGMFTSDRPAHLSATYHIGELMGYSDESVLANPDLTALTTANPSFAWYIHVAVEVNGGATNSTVVYTKLTYYTRMEVPIQVIDTVDSRRLRAQARLPIRSKTGVGTTTSSGGEGSTTGGGPAASPTVPNVLPGFRKVTLDDYIVNSQAASSNSLPTTPLSCATLPAPAPCKCVQK